MSTIEKVGLRTILYKIFVYLIFIIFAIINLFPVFWMFASSFKTNPEFLASMLALPKGFAYINYIHAWIESKIGIYFFNSLYVSLISVFFVVILSLMVSYVLARYQFKLRNLIYVFFLLGMLIPIHTTLVPLFVMFNSFNILNKWFTLLLPYIGFGMPFAIYILESFIRSIPVEIEEAALIDGSGKFVTLFRIILPLCGPAVATVCVMTFFNIWNDFVFPLILVTDDNLKTIPLGLQNFIGPRSANYPQLMAALVFATIPVLLVYFVFQNKLIRGMSTGAVKG
jgi:raffinose/stachyose/melibiose transport system permease protein